MKAGEFVNFVNQSIAPESRLRHVTAEDIRCWTNKRLFRNAPEYYRYDFKIVLALLQVEREAQLRYSSTSPPRQAAPVYKTQALDLEAVLQKGVTQVVSCVASSFAEEQRIVQALKDTGLIGSAGQVAVNFYPFSSQAIQIPSTGAEAKEGNMLVFEADGSVGNGPYPVVTPIGIRGFTQNDASFKKICNSDSVRGHELLPGIEHLVPSEIAGQMRNAAIQERKQFAKSIYTFPVFVPVMKIGGVPATMVDLAYITPNGQKIPPLPTVTSLLSPRLYQAFLNTDGGSMQEIANFVANYNIATSKAVYVPGPV